MNRSTTQPARVIGRGLGALDDLIARSRTAHLYCITPAGPIGYPMTVLRSSGGVLSFSTYAKSAKVDHLRRDSRACVLVLDVSGPSLRWCSVDGEALIVSPSEAEIVEIYDGFRDDRVPTETFEDTKDRLRSGKRLLIRVSIRDPHAVTVREGELRDGE